MYWGAVMSSGNLFPEGVGNNKKQKLLWSLKILLITYYKFIGAVMSSVYKYKFINP